MGKPAKDHNMTKIIGWANFSAQNIRQRLCRYVWYGVNAVKWGPCEVHVGIFHVGKCGKRQKLCNELRNNLHTWMLQEVLLILNVLTFSFQWKYNVSFTDGPVYKIRKLSNNLQDLFNKISHEYGMIRQSPCYFYSARIDIARKLRT